MTDSPPVFIADSCIGGLSVVRSLWDAGEAGNAIFLADYAINPLGVKSDPEIADVVERWLRLADDGVSQLSGPRLISAPSGPRESTGRRRSSQTGFQRPASPQAALASNIPR